MIYQNVFSKKPVGQTTRLHSDTEDFDYTHRMLEHASLLEDNFFTIMKDQMMATHLALKESSVEILQEGFKDFINSAVEFFKKLIEKFKEFMGNVFMYIRAYMGNFEKFLSKYEDRIKELNPDFQLECYEYTFGASVPNTSKLHEIVADYNNEFNDVQNMKKEDLIKERKAFLSSDSLDTIRGYTIGSTSPINSDEYLAAVKRAYRNGQDEPTSTHVDKARLLKAVKDYTELKKLKKECEQDRDNVLRLLESMKDFFNRNPSVHYKGKEKAIYVHQIEINKSGTGIRQTGERNDVEYNGSKLETINLFYNLKFVEAKEIGSMATTAMIEKVNALKEALKLTQTIIRKSLSFSKSPSEVAGIDKMTEGGGK